MFTTKPVIKVILTRILEFGSVKKEKLEKAQIINIEADRSHRNTILLCIKKGLYESWQKYMKVELCALYDWFLYRNSFSKKKNRKTLLI